MKIVLLAMGKTADSVMAEAIDRYLKRLRHYVPFELRILPDVKTGRGTTEEQQKQMEGERFMRELAPGDHVVLLDERGRQLTSVEFASYLDRKMSTVSRNLVFVIGGPYGFSKEMYDRGDELLSLSKMTLTHEMIRLLFTEQVYRAMTILRGEPYHHA